MLASALRDFALLPFLRLNSRFTSLRFLPAPTLFPPWRVKPG